MAGPTPVPFEGVFVLFYFSGNGYSSVRIVHLTGEHFGIIIYNIKKQKNRARSSVNKLKIIKEKDFSYFDDLIYLGAEFRR